MMENTEITKPVYDFVELTKVFQNWASEKYEKRFICTVEDANDGSGDQFLIFPDDALAEIGWNIGDNIKIELSEEKHLILTKIV